MLQKIVVLLMAFLTMGQATIDQYTERMNLGGQLFLVNRDYMITRAYVPDDLRMPNVPNCSGSVLMRDEAATALEEMCAAAQAEAGLTLVALSGYRSYSTQAAIHERKVQSVGKKAALRVSAPPGASEHQLGLAMDLCTTYDQSLTERFGQTPEGMWVCENCWRFGFIIRYKAEWEEITGYMYEPWHVRYVGKTDAREITELDIPLEYYVLGLRDVMLNGMTE